MDEADFYEDKIIKEDNCIECYHVLKDYGIDCSKNCNMEDVKNKLKELYKIHHPDRGGDANIFAKIKNCADKVVRDRCVHEIEDRVLPIRKVPNGNPYVACDRLYNKYRRPYTVKSKCVKSRSRKNSRKKRKNSRCPLGYILRKGYDVPELCKFYDNSYLLNKHENKFRNKFNKESLYFYSFLPSEFFTVPSHKELGNVRKKVYSYPENMEDKISTFLYKFKREGNIKRIENINFDLKRLQDFYDKNGYIWRYVHPNSVQGRRKECIGGDINRSPVTRKCMKPCKENQIRDPKTSRCVNRSAYRKKQKKRSKSRKNSRRNRSKSRKNSRKNNSRKKKSRKNSRRKKNSRKKR